MAPAPTHTPAPATTKFDERVKERLLHLDDAGGLQQWPVESYLVEDEERSLEIAQRLGNVASAALAKSRLIQDELGGGVSRSSQEAENDEEGDEYVAAQLQKVVSAAMSSAKRIGEEIRIGKSVVTTR